MRQRDVGVEGDPLSGNCRSGQVEHPLPSPLAARTPNRHSVARRGGDDLAGVVEHPPLRRIWHGRILAFLWIQGLDRTFESYLCTPDILRSFTHSQIC